MAILRRGEPLRLEGVSRREPAILTPQSRASLSEAKSLLPIDASEVLPLGAPKRVSKFLLNGKIP